MLHGSLAAMTQTDPHEVRSRLALTSSLADLSRVSPWVGELAAAYSIADRTRFAIEVCLEEVLSNIVRHGYAGEAGHGMTVDFVNAGGKMKFVVEDHAEPFEPTRPDDVIPTDLEVIEAGGEGLRLLYRFAGSVEYERLANGNRVTLSF